MFVFIVQYFFSLYIEQAILFTLIFVIFLIIKNFTHFKNYNLYLNSFLIIFIFLIFLYPHKYLLGFIIQQTDLESILTMIGGDTMELLY